ncbi:MAG: TIGR02186 family protein [Paracoccaceae bacterium]
MIRAFVVWLCLSVPVMAEQIVSGLSQNRVSITANFDGSEILIYGAVRRDAPPPAGGLLQVIITVEGPAAPLVIRRKERTAGIWINRSAVTIDSAPSFYAVATTGPINDILSRTENLRHRITLDHVIRAVGISAEAAGAPDFVDALLRIRVKQGHYRVDESTVQLTAETLFRADVVLPANLTEGDYRVRIFLTRDGRVIDQQERRIDVRKAGLERFLFNMAHQTPLSYGILALVLAVLAGWGASVAFRLIRT